ncbi:hypothetical protein Tco_0884912 [Tanacetum coccineum]
MVAYLQKSEGSEGFHYIIDFLTTSHIWYTLTESPTIYVSLIEQFWQTATASTLENGDMEITATIDGKVKIVSEASIRRHLKLEDSDGISTLPNTEIFEQLALMGGEQAATLPHDSPLLRVHSLGSDEGSMTLHELTVLYTILSKKVNSLESDLKQTKLTYGATYTKLIKKVEKLEKIVKSSQARRRERVVVFDDEDELEDPSKQGRKIIEIDQIHRRNSVDTEILLDQEEPTKLVEDLGSGEKGKKEVSTASPEVKTAAESLVYIKRSTAKRKYKGKAVMKEVEPIQKKTRLQLEQERLGYEEALRLQEQLDEEERQRILAQKLQAEERGKFFEAEKARLLVEMINERKRLFAQQRAEQRRNILMTQAQQRTYMNNYIKHMGSHTLQQLKKLSFDEIKELFETTMKRVKDFVPMESDRLVPKISTGSSKRTAETELEIKKVQRDKR